MAHIKAECTLALMPEFTKTACKRWLVERLDLPSITEVLTLRADLPTETSKSAHSWPNLPPAWRHCSSASRTLHFKPGYRACTDGAQSPVGAGLKPTRAWRHQTVCATRINSRTRATSEPARGTFHRPAGGRHLSAARRRPAIPDRRAFPSMAHPRAV